MEGMAMWWPSMLFDTQLYHNYHYLFKFQNFNCIKKFEDAKLAFDSIIMFLTFVDFLFKNFLLSSKFFLHHYFYFSEFHSHIPGFHDWQLGIIDFPNFLGCFNNKRSAGTSLQVLKTLNFFRNVPPNINIVTKYDGFSKCISFLTLGYFWASMLVFGGVKPSSDLARGCFQKFSRLYSEFCCLSLWKWKNSQKWL